MKRTDFGKLQKSQLAEQHLAEMAVAVKEG
jgi:hypothetical protein